MESMLKSMDYFFTPVELSVVPISTPGGWPCLTEQTIYVIAILEAIMQSSQRNQEVVVPDFT